MITDKIAVVGHWLLVVGFSCQPKPLCQCSRQTFKERENEVSQLNRLGKHCDAMFLLLRLLSAHSRRSLPFRSTQVRVEQNLSPASVQVLTDDQQRTTNDCCSE